MSSAKPTSTEPTAGNEVELDPELWPQRNPALTATIRRATAMIERSRRRSDDGASGVSPGCISISAVIVIGLRELRAAGRALRRVKTRVLASRAILRGRLRVVSKGVDEFLDPRVVRRVHEKLVAPSLQGDWARQSRVRRERFAILTLDHVLKLREIPIADRLRVVGDPDSTVLEHVHGVLISQLLG